jgi:hypothetical protein
MGSSPNGILGFGYNLGGSEGEWKIAEVTEGGDWDLKKLAWLGSTVLPDEDPSDDLEEGEDEETGYVSISDFSNKGERRLLVEIGGLDPGDYWHAEGYYDREKAAEAKVGAELVYNGYHEDYGITLLAFKTSVEWDEVEELDLIMLEHQRLINGWDAKLARAVEVLGITFREQTSPSWLLMTKYS